MIGGFYKNHHGLDEEGGTPSGLCRLVIFIYKYKVVFKRKVSVLLNILQCVKKLNFVRVGHGSRVSRRKDKFLEGAKVIVHLLWGSS